MTQKMVPVGMTEIKIGRPGEVLSALGLGSCIGLAAYCRITKIGGMVHIMLPAAFAGLPVDKPGKFADTGVPALLDAMRRTGAGSRLSFAYCGGAQIFAGAEKFSLDIGAKNAKAVALMLEGVGADIQAFDVGGSEGRTMTFDLETGIVAVRSVRGGSRNLCVLGGPH